ncbi:hypothetical protein [Paenibacillus polymyxa]|uniref:hypothetical protein n=1 Tax=Paenibacillus polymyxa TaxID=1406 RepID=UPI0030DABD6F
MNYLKATDLLPDDLLKEVQRYIQGELIYIPNRPSERRRWGKALEQPNIISIGTKRYVQDLMRECPLTSSQNNTDCLQIALKKSYIQKNKK